MNSCRRSIVMIDSNADVRQNSIVTVVRDAATLTYPVPLYDYAPGESYPEYNGIPAPEPNPVYALVRTLLASTGLDKPHDGLSDWNPLAQLIQPGQRVLIKPNWVLDYNQSGCGMDCLVTHTAVLRAVLDYVLLARPGRVVVGDAPIQGCDWANLMRATQCDRLIEHYQKRQHPIEWLDFRRMIIASSQLSKQRFHKQRALDQYVLFNLGIDSLLEPISSEADRFRVTMYDPDQMRRTHQPGRHCYLIAREAIDADVVISLPKLKTHKKAGLTGALKNLVGINGHKDYLPHHRKGGDDQHGDCYADGSWLKARAEDLLDSANRRSGSMESLLYLSAAALVKIARMMGADGNIEGSWYGNDTVWRMALDLNRILMYGQLDGSLADAPQRRLISITDGIVAGEGEGPLASTPRSLGVLTFALSPAAADYVHAYLMGFDWRLIPIVRESFAAFNHPLVTFPAKDVVIHLNGQPLVQPWSDWDQEMFIPPIGWQGHCERAQATLVED